MLTHTWPGPPPGAACCAGAEEEEEEEDFGAIAIEEDGAGVAGAALDEALLEPPLLAAPADLLTPPWPLQAPRPACDALVPSLQVTPPLAEEADDEEDGAMVPDELLVELDAGAELPELLAAVADLSTPP